MSTGFNTLGKIARSGKIAVTGTVENVAILIADHLNIQRDDVYYLDFLEAESGSFTFHYGDTLTPPDSVTFAGSTYSTSRADVVNNAHNLWMSGSGSINLNFIVYVDQTNE